MIFTPSTKCAESFIPADPAGRALTIAAARDWAASELSQPATMSHRALSGQRVMPSKSKTNTCPSSERFFTVTRNTSALVEVATTAPAASTMRPIARYALFPARGGAIVQEVSSSRMVTGFPSRRANGRTAGTP